MYANFMSKKQMMQELINELHTISADGGIILLGVGNEIKGDDGVGSLLAEKLAREFPQNVFNCGTAPENYVFRCAKLPARNVLIVDAVEFGGKAGEVRLFKPSELAKIPIPMTHGPALELVINILVFEGKQVYILGVQPEKTGFEQSLTNSVQRAFDELYEILSTLLKEQKCTSSDSSNF